MALQRDTKKKSETIEISVNDMEWIKATLSGVSSKMKDVDATLIKLNQAVVGDKSYGQVGLIEKVEEHNSYIEKDKEFKSKLIGGGIVVGFIWGMILKFFKL